MGDGGDDGGSRECEQVLVICRPKYLVHRHARREAGTCMTAVELELQFKIQRMQRVTQFSNPPNPTASSHKQQSYQNISFTHSHKHTATHKTHTGQ
jgi:histidinol-phosphate/aromatic aminotransferase/cobyric acid decarboxylase-like protein